MIFVSYIPPYYMDTRLLIIGNTNFISSYSIPAGKARQDAKALQKLFSIILFKRENPLQISMFFLNNPVYNKKVTKKYNSKDLKR